MTEPSRDDGLKEKLSWTHESLPIVDPSPVTLRYTPVESESKEKELKEVTKAWYSYYRKLKNFRHKYKGHPPPEDQRYSYGSEDSLTAPQVRYFELFFAFFRRNRTLTKADTHPSKGPSDLKQNGTQETI